jgi:hypothetical protein
MNTNCITFWVFISLTSIFIVVLIWGIIKRDRDYGIIMEIIGGFCLAFGSVIMWGAVGNDSSVSEETIPIHKNEIEIFHTPVNATISIRGRSIVFDLAKDVHALKDTSDLFFYNYIEKNIYKKIKVNEVFFSQKQLHELKEN